MGGPPHFSQQTDISLERPTADFVLSAKLRLARADAACELPIKVAPACYLFRFW
jgi:hypothetical protein